MLASSSRYLRRLCKPHTFLLALAVFCISQAAILHLHNHFRQLTEQSILDMRAEGYTEEDVRHLLEEAGPQGRNQYLVIEAIDYPYMCSYGFLLSGLLSIASAVAPFEYFKYLNLLPIVAVLVDAAEDALVLSMLLSYPNLVDAVAPIVPKVSQWKWTLLYACVCVVGGSGFYCVAVAAGLAGKRRRKADAPGSQGTTQPLQKQPQRRGKRA